MEFLTLLILVCVLGKIVAVTQATRWITLRGREFSWYFTVSRPHSIDAHYQLLEKLDAAFFPFGVKDYIAFRYLRTYRGARGARRLVGLLLRACYSTLFRYQNLAIASCLYFLVLQVLMAREREFLLPHYWHSIAIYLCGCLMLVMNMLLAIEAVVSLATMGSYGRYFHMLAPGSEEVSNVLTELIAILGSFGVALMTSTGTVFNSYIDFHAFKGDLLMCEPRSVVVCMKIYIQCAYFTMTTLTTVGFGDITPSGVKGQVVTLLIESQAFLICVFGVASLFSLIRKSD